MRLAALLTVLPLAGCGLLLGFDDVRECQGAECQGANPDATPMGCTSSSECSGLTPICDLAGDCVACTSGDECVSADSSLPACDPSGACVECTADQHCASTVCDTVTSTCVAEANVVYMAVDGSTDPSCGAQATPCKQFVDAFAQVTSSRNLIKLSDGTYNSDTPPVVFPADLTATIHAGDAVVDLVGDGNTFEISSGATLSVQGGAITGATAGVGFECLDVTSTLRLFGTTVSNNALGGINCPGTAVLEYAHIDNNGGKGIIGGVNLTVTGGTVSGNTYGIDAVGGLVMVGTELAGNSDDALDCPAVCSVSRSVFRSNGGGILVTGGGNYINNVIQSTGGTGSGTVFLFDNTNDIVFAFNTVINNASLSSSSGGVHCVPGAGTITSPNNLVYWNTDSGEKDDNYKGTCNFTYSNVGVNNGGSPLGGTNIAVDPIFTNFSGSYHLTADSPCKDHGNFSGLSVPTDIDGEARPFNSDPDCGADEFVP